MHGPAQSGPLPERPEEFEQAEGMQQSPIADGREPLPGLRGMRNPAEAPGDREDGDPKSEKRRDDGPPGTAEEMAIPKVFAAEPTKIEKMAEEPTARLEEHEQA